MCIRDRCTTSGAQATGLVPGQVTQLVDPIPYVVSVSNVTTSVEGADIEDDERLRERIRLAPETYTVAGSTGAYEARVLAVSADIEAVSVTSPEPGVVDVRFVLAGGELPDEAMISMVREALSDETVRPLTDRVDVAAPETVDYAVAGRWYQMCIRDRRWPWSSASNITGGLSSRVTKSPTASCTTA